MSGPRGILLYGPPGNGKTLLAKAAAGEAEAHVEIVSGPEILTMWLGESERKLREIFGRARELSPSVILFDELDALGFSRDAAGSSMNSVIAQLLALLDGVLERGEVFVIGTTNRRDAVDAALLRPGRFERCVEVGPPDKTGRAEILARYLGKMTTSGDIDVEFLAARTMDFSGADLEYLCRRAGMLCIQEAVAAEIASDKVAVNAGHFDRALRELIAAKNTQGRIAPR